MKILIIGNGSSGINDKQDVIINNHTGDFLVGLKEKYKNVAYCSFVSKYVKNTNLLNFNLNKTDIDFIPVKQGNKLFLALEIIRLFFTKLWHYDFFYFFFPGSLGRFIAFLAILSGKNIGFYVRGELFGNTWIDRFVLKKSSFLLTVSPSIQDHLLKLNNNVEVIRPMVSICEKDIVQRKLVKKDKYNLLFVGRIEKRKGVIELIDAYKILREKHINIELTLVGGGDLLEEFQKEQNIGKIDKTIIFAGLISDKSKLIEFYKSADVFVFPSHDEGFPRVLYDAMAQSLPILTTMVGGIPGYLKPDYNCVALPLKDANGLADVIQETINKFCSLQALVDESRITIKGILNKKSHEQLFEEYLNSNSNDKKNME